MDVSLMEEVSYFAIQNHTIVEVKVCQDLDYAQILHKTGI